MAEEISRRQNSMDREREVEIEKKRRAAEQGIERLFDFIGEDATREGLVDTPQRYVKFMEQFLTPDKFEMTTFANEGGSDEMIIVANIPFFSLCEHHLAPFFGSASIAYIPTDIIVGLSKLPRTLDMFARRLQNQERITSQVAAWINAYLHPKGVGVILKARHLCVEMRGIQKHDVQTTTSAMLGAFRDDPKCRNEFLNLIK